MKTPLFTTIDDPAAINSTNGTYVKGIDNLDDIVGYYYDSSGNAHGFDDIGGNYITLDYPGSSNQTYAERTNNKGEVVGWYNDRSSDHAFLYSDGAYTRLDVSGAVNTFARAINNDNQIVGYFQTVASGGGLVNHGFIFNGGIYTPIEDPLANYPTLSNDGTANGTVALSINDKGQVVGYFYDNNQLAHSFLYSKGIYTTLRVCPDTLGRITKFSKHEPN
jgi:probable HAF family extracellular repeat protein